MLEIYWGCLIGGVIFTIVAMLVGDLIGGHGGAGHFHVGDHDAGAGGNGWHLDILKPAVIIGAITAFGGAGIMLSRYTSLPASGVIGVAVAVALLIATGVYLLYIRPLRNAESSIGYSVVDLVGRPCEVLVTLPEQGFGEVLVRIGNGVVNHIAIANGSSLPRGAQGVVVEVENGVLVVAPFDSESSEPLSTSLPAE